MLSIHFVLSTIKFHCVFLKYHFLPYLFSFEVFLPHIYKFYVKNIIHACPKISKYDKNFSLKTLRSVNRTSFPHIYTAYQSVCSSGRQFFDTKDLVGFMFHNHAYATPIRTGHYEFSTYSCSACRRRHFTGECIRLSRDCGSPRLFHLLSPKPTSLYLAYQVGR